MSVDALGPCIRALRHKRQISGAELARRSQVTRGMISQIERGSAVPSLDVLTRVCDGLQVSLVQLLQMCEPPSERPAYSTEDLPYEPVVRHDHRRVIAMPRVNQVYESLTPTMEGPIEFSILHIGPLSREASPTYAHQGEECLLVLKGALTVYLGDRSYHLAKGDSMAYPAAIPHAYQCEDQEPAVVVMAETPPAFFDFVARHMAGP
jgi:transcriptional regulator with XRE-family HTH domain